MPSPGTYYIVNRVLSPDGRKLALTFNGERNTVTVTALKKAPKQAVGYWSLLAFTMISCLITHLAQI